MKRSCDGKRRRQNDKIGEWIEDARSTGRHDLDLSCVGLTELPEAVCQLTELNILQQPDYCSEGFAS
jgi:hypothetical protein